MAGAGALAVAALVSVGRPTPALGQPTYDSYRQQDVCQSAPAGLAHCDSRVVVQDSGNPLATTSPPSGALTPSDIQSAYALSGTGGSAATVVVVDAFDNPNAASDLAAYRAQFGLPTCANPCFRKVNQSGQQFSYPAANSGWALEIDLDIEMVSAACPLCQIVLVEANDNSDANLYAAEDLAVSTFHATAISNSWGGSEYSGEVSDEVHFNHPHTAITVSSGDDGFGSEYPAASAYVTAVGGTRLVKSSTARGWTETAWSGSGSGCSAFIAKPSWQTDPGCGNRRTIADVSAVADPGTGAAVYDSLGASGGANWLVVGGTSMSAPIVAALFARSGGGTAPVNPASLPYAAPGSLFDVTSGANGSPVSTSSSGRGGTVTTGTPGCTSAYLCVSQAGYDGPTGLGTPNGMGAFGGSSTPPPTTTSSSTTSSSTTSSTTTSTTSTTAPPTTTTSPYRRF
jgi:subtilase family serine protease